jgi:NADPH-dependent 2,4-dienoyl-CoA reductase/sulfur reductase-like enzyme
MYPKERLMAGKSRPIISIGAVAAGTSAASQAKRRSPDREVVMLEKGPHVSYGACGMPYNILDPKRDIEDLVVIPVEGFVKKRKIDTRVRSEVLEIMPEKHSISVRDHREKNTYTMEYDKLILSTGAYAAMPDIPGHELEGVFKLRELTDGAAIKKYLIEKKPQRAVIIGAGYIALEMLEVFQAYGLEATAMKRRPDVPTGYEPEIGGRVKETLEKHNVNLITGVSLQGFNGKSGRVDKVVTAQGEYPADLVLVATGVKPASELASRAGIEIGAAGAIKVNAKLETTVPDIYAAGDCAEHWHCVLEKPSFVPLGTTANKQGRIAGANAAGLNQEFKGIVATQVFRALDLEVARTGLGCSEAEEAGFNVEKVTVNHRSRAHAYPGSKTITVTFIFEKTTARLLGAQMAGEEGVSKRIDILAACLSNRNTIPDIAGLDLSYAPPFSPVWDPILVCANQAMKKV